MLQLLQSVIKNDIFTQIRQQAWNIVIMFTCVYINKRYLERLKGLFKLKLHAQSSTDYLSYFSYNSNRLLQAFLTIFSIFSTVT